MATLELHCTATLTATVPTLIVAPTNPATGIGIPTGNIDVLNILVTNTGSNTITAATLERSLDPAGTRFSPTDASVAIPGGALAGGASWEISYGQWPAAYWCKLTLTSTGGTTVNVDFLGHSIAAGGT